MKQDFPARRAAPLLLLGGLLVLAFFGSFLLGRYPIPLSQAVRILLSRVFPLEQTWTPEMETAVLNIRLPRICMAVLVGAGLSGAGAAYQGVFRNPMAAPDLLGASGGAALGAALAIVGEQPARVILLCAFLCSLLAVGAALFTAQRAPGRKVINLIFAGIMVSSLCTAGTSFLKLVADPSDQLPAITYWLMGSLAGVKRSELFFAAAATLAGLLPLFLLRWRINLLTLGDDEARALGIDPNRLRMAVIFCATLVTAAGVSVAGVIGWVGLIVPHFCRRLVGGDFRRLLPASLLGGGVFLLLTDTLARNLAAVEVPLGILTALIGAPFFLFLICRKERGL